MGHYFLETQFFHLIDVKGGIEPDVLLKFLEKDSVSPLDVTTHVRQEIRKMYSSHAYMKLCHVYYTWKK